MISDEENGWKKGWYDGLLFALTIMKAHGDEVISSQLVSEVGGIDNLKKAAKRTESEQDTDTIEWLEKNILK